MRKLFLLLAVFICAASLADAQQYRIKYSADEKDPLSVENAIRLALENNYKLLLTEQDVIISQQRLKEAKFLYLPQISVNATATSYRLDYPTVLPDSLALRYLEANGNSSDMFYGLGVQATQSLYSGGRTSSTVSLANAALKESMSRYEAVKSAIIFDVKKAFFDYLFFQKKKELMESLIKNSQEVLSKGSFKNWERVIIKAETASLKSEVNMVNEEISSAHLKMLNVLNKELNSKVVIKGNFEFKPLDVDLPKATLWAMEFRPELKSALYKLEMDNIAVKLSLAKRYPDILLGMGYDRLGQDTLSNENFQATLALKLPIGYDYSTQIKQKRAEQRQTMLKRSAIEDTIRIEVTEAYNNLMFWQTEAVTRTETWDLMLKEINSIKTSSLSIEEKLKILEYYYKSGVRYLEGIKEHLLAKAQLELAVGQDLEK